MKKSILKSLVVVASLLVASSAFAASLVPGSTYSIGSAQPTVFKTSPKVTLNTSLTAGTKATTWGGIAVHESAIDKDKGMAYYGTSEDPGTYFKKKPVAADRDTAPGAPTSGVTGTITGFTAE
jgi:hypothetical protein